ncbi:MAG: NADH-ubiquinone oxidoreductase-F iron-sulfur binding region domain-containing protein [Solirubrobacteraceae bacterium]
MSSPTAMTEISPPRGRTAATLPRLLEGIHPHGAMTLDEHLALHGPAPLGTGGRRRAVREQAALLIDEIECSGLLGRGGGAFPTATKMRAVTGARGRAIVVANGAEGEPASLKDRTLLETLPHLVIDGALIAAQAVGADEVIVCVCESAGAGVECVEQAIAERGADRHSGGAAPKLQLATVPGHYVAGQESALVNYLSGGPAKPLFTPPLPFEQGVRRRPTLVDNVETLAHVALIARHGAEWFRELGTPTQPGSTLVTLAGPVAHPGVYEIEHGSSLASLIEASGGTTARVRAALLGGYAGAWIGGERLHGVALSNEHLAPHGATLGEQACPAAETARLARWMAGQSTRQCGPCVHGLDSLASTVEEMVSGIAHPKATQRVQQLASLTARRGACAHPDGAVNSILSAMEVFAPELTDHARHGPCEACSRAPELPLPNRPVNDEAQRKAARR